MRDILYNAAINYNKMKDIAYEIKLGRKGKMYDLILHFPAESFYHLVGLQHLNDLTFPSTNKERIYKEILRGNINTEYLKKSQFYEKWHIEERISNLYLLETMIDNNKILYKINLHEYRKYTSILADYLLEYTMENIFYLFLVEERINPRFKGDHKGCSFFMKHGTDYTRGTAKATLLLLNKINDFSKETQYIESVYLNPAYKKTHEKYMNA